MACNLNSTRRCDNEHCNCRRSGKIKYVGCVRKKCFKRGALRKRRIKRNVRSNITNH